MRCNLVVSAVILIVNFNTAYAQDSSARLFEQANTYYKENKFDQAILGYNKIIEQGFENGNVYYNLGNSYLKKGELGKAILNYERSRIFMPSDSDLKSNYEYACSLAGLDKGRQKIMALWPIDRLFSGISLNVMAVILFILQGAIFFVLIFKIILGRQVKFSWALIVCLSAAFILTGWSFKRRLDWVNKGAMVVVREAEARFEPLEGSTVHFTLTQGSPVEILDQAPAWLKARRIDGKKGWVKKENLELIKP